MSQEIDATAATASLSKNQIIENFGVSSLTQQLIDRFYALTNAQPHPLLSRFLYFAHRDFDLFLTAFEQGRPVYLYTGRGPSSAALHLGHMIPFFFCKYLQESFKCPLVVQITDDEKLLRDPNLTFEQIHEFALSNIKDILAVGFDKKMTFIYLNTAYIKEAYLFSCQFERLITLSQLRGAFGFQDSQNVGYVSFPAKQMIPAFAETFPAIFTDSYCENYRKSKNFTTVEAPTQKEGETKQQFAKRVEMMKKPIELTPFCLIPCGYEQEPYWRVARDVAPRLGLQKPATIYNSFIPALQGIASKMSASDPANAIYMDDSAAQIKKKINKFAFSGGKSTVELQRELGADISVDVSIAYLEVFMKDQEQLEEIKRKYAKGEMLTGEVKGELIKVLQEVCQEHQDKKKEISDEIVRENVYGWGRKLWE